ncbi:MAG TPA: zinc ribbon domain-containing protein [Allocoleopsis sp.]
MAYFGNLSSTDRLQVENVGVQTAIALSSVRTGQQQSQQTSLITGSWVVPPTLFQTATGWILRIEANQGQFFVQIAPGSISLLSTPPNLLGATVLPLQPITMSASSPSPSMPPMSSLPPLEPLSPLQMGDMQMHLEPMQMRMGNMQMQMGTPTPTPVTEPAQRFCTQCGQAVSLGDRFCAHCGHALAAP